jgi:hypothetical protein
MEQDYDPDYCPPCAEDPGPSTSERCRASHELREDLKNFNAGLRQLGIREISLERPLVERERQQAEIVAHATRTIVEKVSQFMRIAPAEQPTIPVSVAAAFDNLRRLQQASLNAPLLEKLQILLTVPLESWTIQQTATFFSCSEYTVRMARKLRSQGTYILKPSSRTGRQLSDETIAMVQEFFRQEDISRALPDRTIIIENAVVARRFMQVTVEDAFRQFAARNSNVRVGRSKFHSLRPHDVIIPTLKQAHRFCLCLRCQNLKLMLAADRAIGTIHELMPLIACDTTSEACMLGECDECKELPLLVEHLNEALPDQARVLKYKQWDTQSRQCEYKVVERKTSEVVKDIRESVRDKKTHLFVKRIQTSFLTSFLESLPDDTLLLMMDFAENLMCVTQQEVAPKFYSREIVSLFTAVAYRRIDGRLCHRSYGVFSEDLQHDISHVMVALKAIRHAPPRETGTDTIPGNPFDGVKRVCYFTDGARQHFKSRNAMFFLGYHEDLFGTKGEWFFHASGHGKSPCDGIGACLKRLVRRQQLKEIDAPQVHPARKRSHRFRAR